MSSTFDKTVFGDILGRMKAAMADAQQCEDNYPAVTPPSRCAEASDRIEADAREIERLSALYYELLYAVGNKCPGETRHQTALRYIQQAEAPQDNPAQKSELTGG